MQVVDKYGNTFGQGHLIITSKSGKSKLPVVTVAWGNITGVIANQTDLQDALNLKVPTARTITINGVTQDLTVNRTWTISTGITVDTTPITGGVSGRLLFDNAGVVGETNGAFWNVTNQRFGIGTTNPVLPLHVVGGTRLSFTTTSVVHGWGNTLLDLVGNNGTNPGVNEGRLHIGYNQNDPELRVNSGGVMVYTGKWTFIPQIWFAGGITSTHNTAITIDGMSNGVSSGTPSEIFRFTQRGGQFGSFYDAGGGLSEFRIWRQTDNTKYIYLKPGSTSIISSGSLLINSTTDAGYTLDVNGTTRIQRTLDLGSVGYAGTINLRRASDGGITSQITQANDVTVIHNYQGSGTELKVDNVTYFHVRGFANRYAARVMGNLTAVSGLSTALIVNNAISASANNDVLVGLDIAPTYTNGAFTGLANIDLRTRGTGLVIGSGVGYGALYGYNNDGIIQVVDGGTSAITGFSYATQLWLRPSGNAAGLNSNYWATIEQSTGGLYIQSGRYNSNLFLRTGRTGTSGNIYFNNAGGTMAMLFGATGNFAVATTTDTGYKFSVNGSILCTTVLEVQSTNGLRLRTTSAGASVQFAAANTNKAEIKTNDGSVLSMTFNQSGVVGISTQASFGGTDISNVSAQVEINSTTRGFLPPRMTNAQMLAIATPAEGLMVYDLTNRKLCCYDGATWQNLF